MKLRWEPDSSMDGYSTGYSGDAPVAMTVKVSAGPKAGLYRFSVPLLREATARSVSPFGYRNSLASARHAAERKYLDWLLEARLSQVSGRE